MLRDELVHAVGERLNDLERRRRRDRQIEGRGAREADRPHEPVGLEAGLAEHLGQTTGGGTTVEVHLPKAVLRGDVPLKEEEIVFVRGEDVRNAVAIAEHVRALMQSKEPLVAIDRRLRPDEDQTEHRSEGPKEEQHDDGRDEQLAVPSHSVSATTAKIAPPSTFAPASASSRMTRPCTGDRSSFSIFIASSV